MREFDWTGLPARAALHPTGLYLALQNIPADELRDPFMQQTIQRLAAPETIVHLAKTDIGNEPTWTAPKGIIFHVGRCGSTAISQAVRRSARCAAITWSNRPRARSASPFPSAAQRRESGLR